ncbi:succinylglutamate desuccinylase/aspartoacylase family protein [Legionella cincinnatiensis]|uniref:Succinylglutamate desuccinylase/aspartoacylase n=1 Tax=Legionella cincinnatiensis TaxID=28085 RepID=A0A378IJE2_9GAMM|nr:succinylglutamate desuccinylase/aspartoacylase family protein [Legionella cincinnatiensis]KTC89185.1 succinylglutamate desuccinylase/aspartoacylase [Legionella cincinnatiensis]STX35377.1 succinylglutamate desuccinylase/aspartoacylase [Legionella cincinnatiensis]
MKNSKLTICNAIIHPGERVNLALPLPDFYSCTSFYMPIKVIHGKEAGPCLLIFSAVKGDELNGLEIINRLLESDKLSHMRGTLIAVPVLNILGLIGPSRAHNDLNLERCFPGIENGSYGERIAHIFTQEILSKSDFGIELQTGSMNHEILPQIYCDLNNVESKRLAQSFKAPVITNVSMQNNLRKTTEQLGIPMLVYQAGEAMRFDESAINLGLAGIYNVMETLNMLDPANLNENNIFKPVFSQDQDWLRAHRSGVLLSTVELGEKIQRGQPIGVISDPFSADTAEMLKAEHEGIVVGINRNPLIYEGQTIFKVATFIDTNRAEIALEAWAKEV